MSNKANSETLLQCPVCHSSRFSWGDVVGKDAVKFYSDKEGGVGFFNYWSTPALRARRCSECGLVLVFDPSVSK